MSEFDKNLDKDLISYMNSYKIIDDQEIYSNKTEFVPIFRVKQWLEYNKPFDEIERLNNIIDELEKDIKAKYNEAHDYQTKVRQSNLQQGDYPVRYYYAERDEKTYIYLLDKLKELKGSDKNDNL